jgi:hypothetical protein
MSKPSPRAIFIASAAVFVILSSVTIATLVFERHKVEGLFDQYADALSSRDYQKAYSICSPEFKFVTRFEQFQLMHKNLNAQAGPLRRIVRTTSEVKWQISSPNWTGRVWVVWTSRMVSDKFFMNSTSREGSGSCLALNSAECPSGIPFLPQCATLGRFHCCHTATMRNTKRNAPPMNRHVA